MASDDDSVPPAAPPMRRRRKAPDAGPRAAPAAGPRAVRRRVARPDDEMDSADGDVGGGGGGGGGAGFRGLHFDPDEPVREDEEEVVSVPLESIQWTLQPQYQAQLPLSDWCFMCELRQDNNNPFYVTLQTIANLPTLDEEARCVHMARMYAEFMQNSGKDPMPDWPEMAVHRHLTRHDVSQRRVLQSAFGRASDVVQAYSETLLRAKKNLDGQLVLRVPDSNATKTFMALLNFQTKVARDLGSMLL